ncbi:hypothetical protein FTO70_11555 [Methanosarcina sp. KYL-1]|uniref:hypothetical protein n=1 Tax=Methanosarcina sp. KYL-1 TaxID=2602068 RepID=UPI0021010990|nr:hypothetical protein [Methanosarcina sp. KYL-1]MCQ1536302.1 hypothetical protein [Methanosarcina sp. KYL-1]
MNQNNIIIIINGIFPEYLEASGTFGGLVRFIESSIRFIEFFEVNEFPKDKITVYGNSPEEFSSLDLQDPEEIATIFQEDRFCGHRLRNSRNICSEGNTVLIVLLTSIYFSPALTLKIFTNFREETARF